MAVQSVPRKFRGSGQVDGESGFVDCPTRGNVNRARQVSAVDQATLDGQGRAHRNRPIDVRSWSRGEHVAVRRQALQQERMPLPCRIGNDNLNFHKMPFLLLPELPFC